MTLKNTEKVDERLLFYDLLTVISFLPGRQARLKSLTPGHNLHMPGLWSKRLG